jgi:hypothetical protein
MLQNEGVDYASSWTQICNRALGRLGSETVTDLNDGTKNAEYCLRFLPEAIEHILGQWDFKFARRRARLAMLEERPAFGWAYQYNLPKDCVRLVSVGEEAGTVPYQAENGMLLTDADELPIIYIARPDEPDQLPQSIRKAVSTHLAYLMSTALTSNEQLTALIMAEAKSAIEEAKREDAQMNYDPDAAGKDWHAEAR